MNRLLALCLIVLCPNLVFAADPPKALFDWTKQTSIGDITRELSGNLRNNVLDLGKGKVTLTPSVKLVKAEVDHVKLLLTFKVEAPEQTVQFDDLAGALGYYQPMEANPRNITIEKATHTERFIRKGQLTLTILNPNFKQTSTSFQLPEKSEPPKYQLFPTEPPGQAPAKSSDTILDDEKEAVAYIKKIGGIVFTDPKAGGHVVEVHFYAANLPKVKGGARIKKEDLRVIASLKHVRLLDLIHINTPTDVLGELAAMKNLDTLEMLAISDETLETLNKAKQLHTLLIVKAKEEQRPTKIDDVVAIDLSVLGKQISNKGLKELAACKNVTSLTLGGVGLSKIRMPDGIKQLGDFKELKTLKFVGEVFLNDAMIKQFGALKNLTELQLKTNGPSAAKLQTALPNCKILSQ